MLYPITFSYHNFRLPQISQPTIVDPHLTYHKCRLAWPDPTRKGLATRDYHKCRSTLPSLPADHYQYMWWNSAHTAVAAITLQTYVTHSSSGYSLQSANTAVECGSRVCATALSSTHLHSCRTITTSTSTPNLSSFSSPRNSSTILSLLLVFRDQVQICKLLVDM